MIFGKSLLMELSYSTLFHFVPFQVVFHESTSALPCAPRKADSSVLLGWGSIICSSTLSPDNPIGFPWRHAEHRADCCAAVPSVGQSIPIPWPEDGCATQAGEHSFCGCIALPAVMGI